MLCPAEEAPGLQIRLFSAHHSKHVINGSETPCSCNPQLVGYEGKIAIAFDKATMWSIYSF